MSHAIRKPDFRLCENKDADQLRSYCEADQRLCFKHMDSTIPFLIQNFQPLAIFFACTAWFVLDLFGNHIVGFLMKTVPRQAFRLFPIYINFKTPLMNFLDITAEGNNLELHIYSLKLCFLYTDSSIPLLPKSEI